MNTLRLSVAILALLSASACINSPLKPARVQVGRSLNSDNSIGALTTSFKRTDTIYVAVLTTGVGAGSITARWTFGGRVVSDQTKEVRYRGDAATEFHMAYSGGFPVGEYQVEILVDGMPFETRRFRVEN